MLPDNPRHVLLVGDTHGAASWWNTHVLPIADRRDVDVIVQLGDFGVWPGVNGARYLDWLDGQLEQRHLYTVFVDGNHEDFDQLLAIPVDAEGWRWVRPHIAHAPRGHRWTWNAVGFVALGGAASYDRAFRTPHQTWWEQEAITDDDVQRTVNGGSAEVMLTHDAPSGLPLFAMDHQPTRHNRTLLQQAVDAVAPRLLVHGHWHFAWRTLVSRGDGSDMLVLSLACDRMSGACALLDLEALHGGGDTNAAVESADGGPTKPRDPPARPAARTPHSAA